MTRGLLIAALLAVGACRKVEDPAITARSLPSITTKSGITMVLIPAGEFRMGSKDGNSDEAPVHVVRVDSFLMDVTEVTQEQFSKMAESMGVPNPSRIKGPQHPVEMMTWVWAVLYCNARSRAEGLEPCYVEETAECDFSRNGYRLPTEAEWEYACRAGTQTAFSFGNDESRARQYGWFAGNSSKKTHPIGQKKPNPWGLYDMHGNVAEWTNDTYAKEYYGRSPAENPRGPGDGKQYVVRGGSWKGSVQTLRSAYRVADNPGFTDACLAPDILGFRCVRKAPDMNAESSLPTGFVYGEIYLEHKTGEGFPERPERLGAILKGLEEAGLLSKTTRIDPKPASTEWITTIHSAEYVDRVRKACEAAGDSVRQLDTDMPISSGSYDAALAAVGGVLAAVDAVVDGTIRNAFCAVRPPGHHALRDRAMGFCLFNNAAIAARYVQKKHKLEKVLIIDWDVHHGNATQDAFYEDPTVLYFSTHLHPFYPGTGQAKHVGKGEGEGTNINVPLQPGDGDDVVKKAFLERLKPAAIKFKPDFVLISCGFDSHENDTLGRLAITSKGFAELTRIVMSIADECCEGRLVSMLEGGYTLENLASASAAHVRALME